MDVDMDGKFHIHGKPGLYTELVNRFQTAVGELNEDLRTKCFLE